MMTKVLALVVVATTLFNLGAASYACYAPPNFFGGQCDGTAYISHQGKKIRYSISQVNNVGTLIQCQGLGFPNGQRRWYNLGSSSGSINSQSIPFDSVVAKCAIKCKGIPLGTSLTFDC